MTQQHFNDWISQTSRNNFLYMFSRAIFTSATRFGRKKLEPITLNINYPSWDLPISHTFKDEKDLADFLKRPPPKFLLDPETNKAIRYNDGKKINPYIIYNIFTESGMPYHIVPHRGKGLSREQVWDKVFEAKTAAVLKNALGDPGLVELPRVVKDAQGKDVSEWEAVYQLSDGCVVFLEAKYRMSRVSINKLFIHPYRTFRLIITRNTLIGSSKGQQKVCAPWKRAVMPKYFWRHTTGHPILMEIVSPMLAAKAVGSFILTARN